MQAQSIGTIADRLTAFLTGLVSPDDMHTLISSVSTLFHSLANVALAVLQPLVQMLSNHAV